jgi:hypothetical protein
MGTSFTQPPAQPPPDWPTIAEEIHCPLCGYNLRGLTEPRCPECGTAVDFAELFDAARHEHPYLFEHHPLHNAWSILQTLRAGLHPNRFWTDLRPVHRLNIGRLILYWVLCGTILLFLMPPTAFFQRAIFIAQSEAMRSTFRPMRIRATRPPPPPPVYTFRADRLFFQRVWDSTSQSIRGGWGLTPLISLDMAWPWTTLGVLLLFRQSMRLGKVRPAHLFRCVIYSADSVIAYSLLLLAFWVSATVWLFIVGPTGPGWPLLGYIDTYPLLLLWTHRAWRLGVAAEKYLGLHRGMWLVFFSQIALLLSAPIAIRAALELIRLIR